MDHLTETRRCLRCHKRKKCYPSSGVTRTGYSTIFWFCDTCLDNAKEIEDEHDNRMEQESLYEGTREL